MCGTPISAWRECVLETMPSFVYIQQWFDMRFTVPHTSSSQFIVDQGVTLVVPTAPFCCPSLTTDYFLCMWSFRGGLAGSTTSSSARQFSRVKFWLTVLQFAQALMAAWVEGVKVSSQVLLSIATGLGLPLIALDSRVAGSIFTVWFDPANGNSGTIGKNRLPNCATVTFTFPPIESEVACFFASPSNVLFPIYLWNGSSNSIPLGTCRFSSDVCAQWRNHFSPIVSCQNAEIDTVFAVAISDLSSFGLSGRARTLPQVVAC